MADCIDFHLKRHPEFKLATNRKSFFCQACDATVNINEKARKKSIESHANSEKHRRHLEISNKHKKRQSSLNIASTSDSQVRSFHAAVAMLFIACDIAFEEANHPAFKKLCAEQCNKIAPDEITLRKLHLKPIYEKTIKLIRDDIDRNAIFVQIDESSDSADNQVVNVLVGKLDGEKPTTYLLDVVKLDAHANSSLIVQTLLESLSVLWPDSINYNKLHLLVTDQAPYMMAAGRLLKN